MTRRSAAISERQHNDISAINYLRKFYFTNIIELSIRGILYPVMLCQLTTISKADFINNI